MKFNADKIIHILKYKVKKKTNKHNSAFLLSVFLIRLVL